MVTALLAENRSETDQGKRFALCYDAVDRPDRAGFPLEPCLEQSETAQAERQQGWRTQWHRRKDSERI